MSRGVISVGEMRGGRNAGMADLLQAKAYPVLIRTADRFGFTEPKESL
jgi:hypothetical protein